MMEISLAIWILGCSRFTNTLTSPSYPIEAMSHMQHLCCAVTQHFAGRRRAREIAAQLCGKSFAEFCASSSGLKIMDAGGRDELAGMC